MPEKEDPMAVAATETRVEWLVEMAEHLDVPDGTRVEIIDGSIVVSPTPQLRHARIVRFLETALRPTLPAGSADFQNVTIEIPATGERYIPDLLVLPESEMPDDEWLFSAEACMLAIEVTSPNNPEIDRVKKPHGYARAGVPLYLLVDAVDRSVTLFSEPIRGVYSAHAGIGFGSKIHIPEPFDVTIDTAEFP